LFSDALICDWSYENPKLDPAPALAMLRESGRNDCALFARIDSIVVEETFRRQADASCTVIEEPLVNQNTLVPVLSFLQHTTDLALNADFINQPGFVVRFRETIGDRVYDLGAARHLFDEIVLTETDPATNKYTAKRAEDHIGPNRLSITDCLRDFLSTGRHVDLRRLVMAIEGQYLNGHTGARLVSTLYRTTASLLVPEDDHPPGRRKGRRSRAEFDLDPLIAFALSLWGALLLAWEARLLEQHNADDAGYRRRSDVTIVRWDQMARNFLVRRRSSDEDALAGCWAPLRETLSKLGADDSTLDVNRRKLASALERHLATQIGFRSGWIERLVTLINSSLLDTASGQAPASGGSS